MHGEWHPFPSDLMSRGRKVQRVILPAGNRNGDTGPEKLMHQSPLTATSPRSLVKWLLSHVVI